MTRAEAYEQITRICVAVIGTQYVAERIRSEAGIEAAEYREQAIDIAQSAIGMCAYIEAGQDDLLDDIRQCAETIERIEDNVILMLHHPCPRLRLA
jgi:hypothetical protein